MSDTGLKVKQSFIHFYQVQQHLFVVCRVLGVLAKLDSNGEFSQEEISVEPEWWVKKQKNIETFDDKYIIWELIRDGLTIDLIMTKVRLNTVH